MKERHITMSIPKFVVVPCHICAAENRVSILILGDIAERKMLCGKCRKTFYFSLKWVPNVTTKKDMGNG